jgi:hypothetical protein
MIKSNLIFFIYLLYQINYFIKFKNFKTIISYYKLEFYFKLITINYFNQSLIININFNQQLKVKLFINQ